MNDLIARLRLGNLRVRLVSIVVFAMVPAITFTLFALYQHRSWLLKETREESYRLVSATTSNHAAVMQGAHQLLTALSHLPTIVEGDPAAKEVLVGLSAQFPVYANIFAAFPDGQVFASAVSEPSQEFRLNSEVLRQVRESGGAVIAGFQQGGMTGQQVMILVRPVLDADRELRAVVGLSIPTEWFDGILDSFEVQDDSLLMVFDQNGEVISEHMGKDRVVHRDGKKVPFMGDLLRVNGQGVAEADCRDGVRRLFAFTPLIDTTFGDTVFVTVGTPVDWAEQTANRELARNALVFALALLIAIAGAWTAGEKLVLGPVRRLLSATKRIAAGDFTVRSGIEKREGELYDLGRHFDVMVAALRSRDAELRKIHADLEQRVEERTRELNDKNVELEEREAYLRTITAHVPGMVFRARVSEVGRMEFSYVSSGAHALCALQSEQILSDASSFLGLLHPQDRDSFMDSFMDSFNACVRGQTPVWEWTGRIHVAESAGIRWVNVRAQASGDFNGSRILDGVMLNVTDSKIAEAHLKQSQEQLQALTVRLQEVREEEQGRIAREIHDGLGSLLTALKVEYFMLARLIRDGSEDKLQQAQTMLDRLSEGFSEAIETVRTIAQELRPRILDDLGIVPALQWYVQEFERRTGIICRLNLSVANENIGDERSTALFRICQEALTNVARHAHATEASIRLKQRDGTIRMEIRDNGQGIDGESMRNPRSTGLYSMQERASRLGGMMMIQAGDAGGCVITVILPLVAFHTVEEIS